MPAECPRCHVACPDDSSFCGKCGAPLAGPAGGPKTRPRSGQEHRQDLPKGSLVAGKDRILEELGAGGMGIV